LLQFFGWEKGAFAGLFNAGPMHVEPSLGGNR
jgi:hypothetical protein